MSVQVTPDKTCCVLLFTIGGITYACLITSKRLCGGCSTFVFGDQIHTSSILRLEKYNIFCRRSQALLMLSIPIASSKRLKNGGSGENHCLCIFLFIKDSHSIRHPWKRNMFLHPRRLTGSKRFFSSFTMRFLSASRITTSQVPGWLPKVILFVRPHCSISSFCIFS